MRVALEQDEICSRKEEAQVEIKFGIGTFGDMTLRDDGTPETAGQVLRNVVLQAVHAEEVGLDSFDAGEHHRDDFAITSPDTVLAGIATLTKRIKLGSGVTVLSSEDPVRVYQAFCHNRCAFKRSCRNYCRARIFH